MSEFTPNYALPYPSTSMRPRGDEQLRDLAEASERALKELIVDTGSDTQAPLSMDPDWALLIGEFRLIGKICFLHIWVSRTAATITAGAAGAASPSNLPSENVCVITDLALRPTLDYIEGQYRGSRTSGVAELVTASGQVNIEDAHTSSSLVKDSADLAGTVQISFAYPIP